METRTTTAAPDTGGQEDDQQPREHCGVFACYGVPEASRVIYAGLFSLQHRGQEGAGMVVADGGLLRYSRGMGLVSDVFSGDLQRQLPGVIGIGHVRYSTTGASRAENLQPLLAECRDGTWAIAHNGNLVNAQQLRARYQRNGAIFQTSTDSEILLHELADPVFFDRPRRVADALAELQGAFSFVLLNRNAIMAARDPWGFRPLSIGRLGDGYVVASETCALAQTGAIFIRDVQPGELVTIDKDGLHSERFAKRPDGGFGQCVFEHIYFARPDSQVFGQSVYAVRTAIGRRLAQENPVEADVIVPIPDSGLLAALGYAEESGIPLHLGFIRNHYVGRTFIMPSNNDRRTSADLKLSVVPEVVRGRRVIVVDDSIIRGNTCRKRMESLRLAGATEVHLRISCPPTRHPCYFGIDFPDRTELVAADRSVDEVRRLVGADSLGYLSIEGLRSSLAHPDDYCMGCFQGSYPCPVETGISKNGFENACAKAFDTTTRHGGVP
jgi:amidophosphoribosyltransferase